MLTLALLALVQGSPRVSLTVPAARIPVVLEAIAKQAECKLAADAVMAKEVVGLRVASVPAEDVLAKIAEATGGEWRMRDGIKTLSVSAEVDRRDETEREKRRTQAVIALAANLAQPPKPIDEDAFRRDMERLGAAIAQAPPGHPPDFPVHELPDPKKTLLNALIRLIPPSAYVGLRGNARIVFASNPNGMQVTLPEEAQAWIDRFTYEKRLVERFADPVVYELYAKRDPSVPPLPVPPALPENFKVLLAVRFIRRLNEEPSFGLQIVDDRGKVVDGEGNVPDERTPPAAPDPITSRATTPIEPSDDEAEYLRWYFGRRSAPSNLPPGLLAKWRTRLADPVKYEPLAWIAQRLVRAAENEDKNFVADLPDRASVFTGMAQQAFTPAQLWSMVSGWGILVRGPEWIVVRPDNYAENREARLDRGATKRFYAQVAAKDGMFIDDAGEYAQSSDSQWLLGVWDWIHIHVLESRDGRYGLLPPSGSPRLYGSLSPEQKQSLFAGGLHLRELNERTRELLHRDFYWPGWQVNFEPTEALPNGLPADGYLHVVKDVTSWAVVPVQALTQPKDGEIWAALSTPYMSGQFGANIDYRGAGGTGSYRHFRLIRVRTITLQADYAPGIQRQWPLLESSYTADPVMTFADLPQEFRDAVARARAQSLKQVLPAPIGPPP